MFKPTPAGNTTTTVVRIWINNGSTTGTAANNTLIGDQTLTAVTASSVAGVASSSFPINRVLPAGYKIICTIATASANGWKATGFGANTDARLSQIGFTVGYLGDAQVLDFGLFEAQVGIGYQVVDNDTGAQVGLFSLAGEPPNLPKRSIRSTSLRWTRPPDWAASHVRHVPPHVR